MLTAITQSVERFQQRSSAVPQLKELYDKGFVDMLATEEESGIAYIGRTYLTYLKFLKCIAELSDEEVQQVVETEELVEKDDERRAADSGSEVNKGSAAKTSHTDIMIMLGKEHRKELYELAIAGANVDSPIFAGALEECVRRLEKGSAMAAEGIPPSDKDPRWDDAYSGHTRNLSPQVMVHFVISHYLTRTFQAKYNKRDAEFGELAFDKDAIHGILSVGMRIMIARGKCPKDVEEMWIRTRENGGLQWHNDKYDKSNTGDPKQIFYDKAFGAENGK